MTQDVYDVDGDDSIDNNNDVGDDDNYDDGDKAIRIIIKIRDSWIKRDF